jgi:hypothetical protein
MHRLGVLPLLLITSMIFPPLLFAADVPSVSLPIAQMAEEGKSDPEPYTDEEFPSWAHSLRRGEILLFGSLPITFLLTNIGYGLIRFAAHDFDSSYTPGLFGGSELVPYEDGEKIGMIAVSLSLSAVLASVDYFIGRSRAKDAQ